MPSADPVATDVIVARLRAAGCVFAEDEARLLIEHAGTQHELDRLVARRAAGLPLEQILGWVEFCGLRLTLEPGVFVPRRRSEFLVHEAARLTRSGSTVLDLCCGCGALGVAVAHRVDGLTLHASDIDPAAVACAARNMAAHEIWTHGTQRRHAGRRGTVHLGDLFAPLPRALRGHVDTIVANVPYVPTAAIATMPPEAREHEPRRTLDGGADGLDVLRRVATEAADWLAPAGHLLIETGEQQADDAMRAYRAGGLDAAKHTSAEFESTVIIGTRR